MCEHEDRNCPGRNCRCECMNCMFPETDCDDAACRVHGTGDVACELDGAVNA